MDQPLDFPTNPKVGILISDITKLMNEAEQMLAESTSHHAEAQVELLNETEYDSDSVPAAFGRLCVGTGQGLADTARCTHRAIRRNPYRSLFLALGAGVLLGTMLARRDN